MTKKKFLSELEKKLSVLDDSEIQDIINEYRDIIDEKVKHGKTEKEVIEDNLLSGYGVSVRNILKKS